jgi:hypothetical protein
VSLSDTRAIQLLNRHFIPVYLSNEDYAPTGAAPPAEKAELQRIHREGHAAGLSVGTVHVYLLAPDGRLIDSMHTAQAAQTDLLIGLLERTRRKLGTPAGDPVVKPAPPSPPHAQPDELRLHLTARYLERRGDTLTLTGQDESAGGNWNALPSEDWIMLPRARWTALLPPGSWKPSSAQRRRLRGDPTRLGAGVGQSWEIERDLASALLTHFYPPTENWDLSTHRIDHQSLKATVVSIEPGRALARIEGSLRMKHPFYHKDDPNFVEATIVGYMEYEPGGRRIHSLRLVTDQATYHRPGGADLPFGVAVTTR